MEPPAPHRFCHLELQRIFVSEECSQLSKRGHQGDSSSYAIEGCGSRFDGEQTCRLAFAFFICFGGGVLSFVLFLVSPLWFIT